MSLYTLKFIWPNCPPLAENCGQNVRGQTILHSCHTCTVNMERGLQSLPNIYGVIFRAIMAPIELVLFDVIIHATLPGQ